MNKLCVYGTALDRRTLTACRAKAAAGADYCERHIGEALACIVRYCPDLPEDQGNLCAKHEHEFLDQPHTQTARRSLVRWLASRPNEQASKIEGLAHCQTSAPGFASLESIGVVLFLCFFGLFLLSIFALIAGASLRSPGLIVPGALLFVGFLSVVAVLVVLDPKPPKSTKAKSEEDEWEGQP